MSQMAALRRSCNLYVGRKEIFIVSAAKTIPGFLIDSEPIFKLSNEADVIEIGASVLKALEAYRVGVAPPGPDMIVRSSPLLVASGYKSWAQLERGRRNVFVVQDGEIIRAVPTEKSDKGGFLHLNNVAIESGHAPEEIGHAVRRAAALSK